MHDPKELVDELLADKDSGRTPSESGASVQPPDAPPPSHPMAVARWFLEGRYTHSDSTATLRRYLGDFYAWDGVCWPPLEDAALVSDLYRALELAEFVKGPKVVPWEPNRKKVGDVVAALGAAVHLAAAPVPLWLKDHGVPASEVVAMQNGLLHVPSRTLLPHHPDFFTQHALAFAFDPDAPEPTRWLRFLDELWNGDCESIDALQEVMGYLIAGGTEQQKLFLVVGPKRSGKGTIARVLKVLLGEHNVAGPTLASLATQFGLQGLIGKPLAVVSDMRIGSRADSMTAVELLSISGEDIITVDRKYKDPWTGQLPTRFMILSNELPRFADASGALASRFVLLTLHRSFYGQEDLALTRKLASEATGILNWALAGLDRLTARGHFVPPTSAAEALRQIEDMASPVGAFVRDRCTVGPFEEGKDALWAAWKDWSESEGIGRPGTKAVFARDLRAAVPGLQVKRLREGEKRWHVFVGLKLGQQREIPLTHPDREHVVTVGQGSGPLSAVLEPSVNGEARADGWKLPAEDLELIAYERYRGREDATVAALLATRGSPPPPGFPRWTGYAVRVALGEASRP